MEMSKTGDGYSASTHWFGTAGTGGSRPERLGLVDKERDARVGWEKGGRLKIRKDKSNYQKQKSESDN